MCRLLAYCGPPRPLGDFIVAPAHSLIAQARHPRLQTAGKDNADGFGVCWFDDGGAHRYRSATAIGDDDTLSDLAETTVAGAFLAAVRSATPGLPIREANSAPFESGGL